MVCVIWRAKQSYLEINQSDIYVFMHISVLVSMYVFIGFIPSISMFTLHVQHLMGFDLTLST